MNTFTVKTKMIPGDTSTWIDVKDYGADPTGSTASDAAFLKALDKIHNDGGGTLRIPAGTYTLAGVSEGVQRYLWVYSNTHIIGDGDVTIQAATAEGPKSLFRNATSNTDGGYTATSNIVIENIYFSRYTADEAVLKSGPLLGLCHADGVIIRRCKFGSGGEALGSLSDHVHQIELVGCKNVYIEDCEINAAEIDDTQSELVNIDGCTPNSYGAETYVKWDGTPCRNITIRNCTFHGFDASGSLGNGSPAIGNHFSGNNNPYSPTNTSGYTTHENIYVIGNRFFGDWNTVTSNRRDTINFNDGALELNVANNVFYGGDAQYNKGVNVVHPAGGVDVNSNCFINYDSNSIINSNLSGACVAYNDYVADSSSAGIYDNLSGTWQARV